MASASVAAQSLAKRKSTRWLKPFVTRLQAHLQRTKERRGLTHLFRTALPLLITHGGARGLSALTKMYASLPAEVALRVLKQLAPALKKKGPSGDAARQIARASLDDRRVVFHTGVSRCPGPWVLKTVAATLVERYIYPGNRVNRCPWGARERRVRPTRALNALRRRAGLKPLSLPKRRQTATPPPAAIKATLDALKAAQRPEDVAAAMTQLKALGVGARLPVGRAVIPWPKSHPARRAVTNYLEAESRRVRTLRRHGLKSASGLQGLKGKRLTPMGLLLALSRLIANNERGALALRIERDAVRGVSLDLFALAPSPKKARLPRGTYRVTTWITTPPTLIGRGPGVREGTARSARDHGPKWRALGAGGLAHALKSIQTQLQRARTGTIPTLWLKLSWR